MQSKLMQQNIQYLKGVGEKRAKLFCKLGIPTVGAVLRHYPRSYLNILEPFAIAEAPLDEPVAVKANVYKKLPPVRISGGRTMIRVYASDGNSDLEIVYFNNKFAPAALAEGGEYIFFGKLKGSLLDRQMVNPTVIKADEAGSLVPQYPLTEGLSSKIIATVVKNAFELCKDEIYETLPHEVIKQYGLVSRETAIHDIHFPKSYEEAAAARYRLIFEELLTLQLGMHLIKSRERKRTAVQIDAGLAAEFISSLPYSLTEAQKRSVDEILNDIQKDLPMNRLLQGDVGSGKTVVAACGVFCAAKSGYQSVIMAPTEILANQHAETFSKLLEPFGITVGLLTSSVKGKAREQLLVKIADGECDVVIGTHAVIGEAVKFNNVGFVVADEQHRFGVEQRGQLSKKGNNPHFLVMSATPIPRTLALIIYGDLDISVIDELPPGRKKIKTYLVDDEYRARYLGFVRKIVNGGGQAYIVCPLVEESEALSETLSAAEYKRELEENYLNGISIGLVHGRMKPKEKAEVMENFAKGEISALVSTTVIEVGVDVPNANVMIIENAERFGLSALHQLRGRIGRGTSESYCIVVSSSKSPSAQGRLEVLKNTDDGFEIARYDLKTRGPGDFFGKRQHGLPELHIADLATDESIIYKASEAAKAILEKDTRLRSPEFTDLRKQVESMFEDSGDKLN